MQDDKPSNSSANASRSPSATRPISSFSRSVDASEPFVPRVMIESKWCPPDLVRLQGSSASSEPEVSSPVFFPRHFLLPEEGSSPRPLWNLLSPLCDRFVIFD